MTRGNPKLNTEPLPDGYLTSEEASRRLGVAKHKLLRGHAPGVRAKRGREIMPNTPDAVFLNRIFWAEADVEAIEQRQ